MKSGFMKHLEASEHLESRVSADPMGARPVSGWKLLAAALALVGGLSYGMSAIWNPTPYDRVSDAEKSELISAFSKLESVKVEPVTDEDREAALDSMRLAPHQRQALKGALAAPHSAPPVGAPGTQADVPDLVWLVLWDFAAADGDIVRVSTAGYKVDIPLHSVQTRIAVPVDAARMIEIVGVRDGGGGITLGVQNEAGVLSLPVLQVGQTLSLPVSF